jgi:hypothetical protein
MPSKEPTPISETLRPAFREVLQLQLAAAETTHVYRLCVKKTLGLGYGAVREEFFGFSADSVARTSFGSSA